MNKKTKTQYQGKRRTRLKRSLWIRIGLLLALSAAISLYFQSAFSCSFSRRLSARQYDYSQNDFLFLVDQDHPWPEEKSIELRALYHGQISVDERIYEPLAALLSESSKQGIHLKLAGGYRSSQIQQALFEQSEKSGNTKAQNFQDYCDQTLMPASSEHQSALAVDLVPARTSCFDPAQSSSLEYRWLQAHCMDYGFILRYPQGKEKITRHACNPWHYRYVGLPAAKEIMQADLCLEEYLALLEEKI